MLAGLAVFVAVMLLAGRSPADRVRRLGSLPGPVGRPRRWRWLVVPVSLAGLVVAGGVLSGAAGAAVCFAIGLPVVTALLPNR